VLLSGVDEWFSGAFNDCCQGIFAAAHHMCNSVLAGGMAVEAWVDWYVMIDTSNISPALAGVGPRWLCVQLQCGGLTCVQMIVLASCLEG
jgi:hypothetical protein